MVTALMALLFLLLFAFVLNMIPKLTDNQRFLLVLVAVLIVLLYLLKVIG